uniref:Uncharacterized protein n=1 Tax=Timema cristinae TaxID=61476 RepID=A0A7R9CTS0_TIMCR|nr:unnamed protein product [Timema cristinae]
MGRANHASMRTRVHMGFMDPQPWIERATGMYQSTGIYMELYEMSRAQGPVAVWRDFIVPNERVWWQANVSERVQSVRVFMDLGISPYLCSLQPFPRLIFEMAILQTLHLAMEPTVRKQRNQKMYQSISHPKQKRIIKNPINVVVLKGWFNPRSQVAGTPRDVVKLSGVPKAFTEITLEGSPTSSTHVLLDITDKHYVTVFTETNT